jgi:hypothetical protein
VEYPGIIGTPGRCRPQARLSRNPSLYASPHRVHGRAPSLQSETLAQDEQAVGLDTVIDTVSQILSESQPLHRRVIDRFPANPDPQRDLVFIVRVGALFPFYRTSPLPEQMKGQLQLPTVLFYPGDRDGIGLRFMGLLDADYNYRCKIF